MAHLRARWNAKQDDTTPLHRFAVHSNLSRFLSQILKGIVFCFLPGHRLSRKRGIARILAMDRQSAPDLTIVVGEDFGLVEALSQNPVAGFGKILSTHMDATANLLSAVSPPLRLPGAR